MNSALSPDCLLYLSVFLVDSFSASFSSVVLSTLSPQFSLWTKSILPTPLLSLCLFSSRTLGSFFLLTTLLFFTVSHSQLSLLPSLVLFHTHSPPHKVAFLSLISLFPRLFLLLLSCAFWNSLFIFSSFPLLPVLLLTHTRIMTHTQAHSVILLLSQN